MCSGMQQGLQSNRCNGIGDSVFYFYSAFAVLVKMGKPIYYECGRQSKNEELEKETACVGLDAINRALFYSKKYEVYN